VAAALVSHRPQAASRDERAQLRELASAIGAKYEIMVMEWLLRRLVLAEAIIAIVVLAVTALLGIALPPRAG
jgi:hypothetical protein